MSLLRRIWRATGHPDIAALYAHAQPGASAVERLKRLGEIIETPPPHRAAGMALARSAIDAYDWPQARLALAPFIETDATQGVASLMAEIEEGQNGDQGKAREWLSRAMRAPRCLRMEGAGDLADTGAGTGYQPCNAIGDHRARLASRTRAKRNVKDGRSASRKAALAQLVEHIIRNDGVRCSSHLSGTIFSLSVKNQAPSSRTTFASLKVV